MLFEIKESERRNVTSKKPEPVPENLVGNVVNRPTSPPPPRKSGTVADEQSPHYWVGYYRKRCEHLQQDAENLNFEKSELIEALRGVWQYATTGAQVTDVNTHEQHQFVTARAVLKKHGVDMY